jgi:D-3-phosphoglycerate dehydrogenase
MKRIFLTEDIHPLAIKRLRRHFEIVHGKTTKEEEIISRAVDCDGILVRSARITSAIMERLPQLKIVAKHGVGVDAIDVEAASERGILVVNTPLSNLNAVAEHTLAMLMALSKNLVYMDKRLRGGDFESRNVHTNTELRGKTLGLLGFGKIAKALTEKLRGFDMKILAYDPFADAGEMERLAVEPTPRDALLQRSDFISIHLPLTPHTKKMIDWEFIKQMKATAVLVNASRGPIVDEKALAKALTTGRIRGAALDVFDPEPPRADNPLFGLANVIVSPHNAALTEEALLDMATTGAQGLIDYFSGRAPEYPVNPEVLQGRGLHG